MQAITNLSLKDQIANTLRREITSGNMKDGEELTQETIAAALAVSRIPIREAFLQLEAEGLLRRLPNRHVQVVGLTKERRHQNLQILASFECAVAALLAENWSCVQLAPVDDDEAFHLALSRSLKNPTLEQLHAMQRRSLFVPLSQPSPDELLQRNQAIADAAAQQDFSSLCVAISSYYNALTKEPTYEASDPH